MSTLPNKMIIGLGYKAGAGKDEFAKILVLHHGFAQIGFADKLKQICTDMFNWEEWWCYNAEGKAKVCPVTGKTVREVLQLFGEMMRQTFGRDIWIKIVDNEIQRMDDERIVISDVRYLNEFEYVKKVGIACRIHRPHHLRRQAVTQGIENHPSEVELDSVHHTEWNAIICNDAGLDKLNDAVARITELYLDLRRGVQYCMYEEGMTFHNVPANGRPECICYPEVRLRPDLYEPEQQPIV